MINIRFKIILTALALSLLLMHSKALFAQSRGESKEKVTSTEGWRTTARQSPEVVAAALQNAERTGSLVYATIEIPVPLAAFDLENVALAGEIQSIHVTSTTSVWKGAIYSTPNSPINSLADGLRSYEHLYHNAVTGDSSPSFAMAAFTVRGSAFEVSRVRDSLSGANVVSVIDSSQLQGIESKNSVPTRQTSETSKSGQETAALASSAFVPNNAELSIATASDLSRRVQVSFSWNTPEDLAGFAFDRSALEIQVLFLNHADNPEAANISYIGDEIISWGSNFNGYLDTPALNGRSYAGTPVEREVTIGSADARSAFKAGQKYTMLAYVERGKLDANFAKLSFQLGIYKPTLDDNAGVYGYCLLHGGSDPASCVAGIPDQTIAVTPKNYTGSPFSILAPTVPSFTRPTPICTIPPGYPLLNGGLDIPEQQTYDLGFRMLRFQRAVTINGGIPALGCPTNFVHPDTVWWPRGGLIQDFDGSRTGKGKGAIMLAPGAGQAFWIHGAIWARYASLLPAGPQSVVGEPTGDEQSITSSRGSNGAYQGFTRGWLYFNGRKNQTYYVVNAIAQKYKLVGLHTDPLGFPTSDEYAWNGGARNDFEGGYIYWTPSTGAVIVRNTTTAAPTISTYTWSTTPFANQPFGGTITGTNLVSGMEVWFCAYGSSTACYQHPPVGVNVTSPTNLNVTNVKLGSGSWQILLKASAGQSARSTPFTVQTATATGPTITRYIWNTPPQADQPFSGIITGTNFVSGSTQVWFCVNGTNTCYQQPPAGVVVSSPTSLSVTNVRLGSGSWQIFLKNSAGQSPRSAAFIVQSTTVPTIARYTWNTTPQANQSFSGVITGTNFVSGSTQVWFCVNGTNTCYQQPVAGVSVTSPTSLSVINIRLGSGLWQMYLKTAAGQSARSTAFAVQAANLPTITRYIWNATPQANQSFSGVITGTNFVSGGTQVWFCVNGTNTCYQQPAAGVTVSSPTGLSVINVRLGSGLWQMYVKTAAGQSARSAAFAVQGANAPTIGGYSWNTAPIASQPFSGTISGTGFVSGSTQVWFCASGTNTCYQQPAAGVIVNSTTSLTVSNVTLGSGSWQIYLKTAAGQSARSTAFTVQTGGPTITGYSWSTPPIANQSFNGTITGTGFISGSTQVWFCLNGTNTCYQQPIAGVTVNSPTSLSVVNVKLGGGSWQFYVQTTAGQSARSTSFTVQTPAGPTINGYSWDSTPRANQSFDGTITGTGFVVSGTQVWFCVNGTNTCYQQPAAGVNVNGSTSLSVSNVSLGSGSWQIYVQTSAGQSARSTAFTVQAQQPTISSYSWNSTPIANQPFSGTVWGAGFVSGGTQVWFCVNGTSTCYQQPSAGVSVNSSTNLSVSNVNLGSGSWQIYLQTSAGSSTRSIPFTVQAPGPTISWYSWNTTPVANQPFAGTVNGTGFIASGTQVWFCLSGNCYQHPGAGITVNSTTGLSVSNVNLSSGSWQFYVKTSAGQSARSTSFTVW